ncbi:hypothetical protein Amsp01_044230 [Amycolatopsis sp. NBRC 101858]|uniref:AMP-binding enzyme n=1 Tax=Amycolatopsis sp. NBRC 101858 TaxID=3032200 RepID=UPI0024A390E4|nr:hypothetical protein [Amycolatopsis sp. NBRC 101858]GLY38399.1 hypothetical protein Amsp01_044230 [Amycolatopsis sp. NBRC 101858]
MLIVIEKALRVHPAVRDAAAAGIPYDLLGEVPAAAVTFRAGVSTAELGEWLAGQLTRIRCPRK